MNLCIVFLAAEWKLKFKTARRNGKQRGYFTKVINCPCYIIVKYVPHKKQILGNLQFWLVFFNIDIWYLFFFDLFCLAWDGWQSISWKQIYNEHSCILILEKFTLVWDHYKTNMIITVVCEMFQNLWSVHTSFVFEFYCI